MNETTALTLRESPTRLLVFSRPPALTVTLVLSLVFIVACCIYRLATGEMTSLDWRGMAFVTLILAGGILTSVNGVMLVFDRQAGQCRLHRWRFGFRRRYCLPLHCIHSVRSEITTLPPPATLASARMLLVTSEGTVTVRERIGADSATMGLPALAERVNRFLQGAGAIFAA